MFNARRLVSLCHSNVDFGVSRTLSPEEGRIYSLPGRCHCRLLFSPSATVGMQTWQCMASCFPCHGLLASQLRLFFILKYVNGARIRHCRGYNALVWFLAGTGERHGAEAAAQRLHDVTKQALGLIYSSLGTESIKWGAISLQQLVSAQERVNVLGSFCT